MSTAAASDRPSRSRESHTATHDSPAVTALPIQRWENEAAEDSYWWVPREGHRFRGWRLAIKRALDVCGALMLLAVVWPILVATMVAVRLTSPGPAIFAQTRVGRNGNAFTIYKFRTMQADAEGRLEHDPFLYARYREGGFKLSITEDPRVTRIGAVLRARSLDELPQLFNVLKGDMSLVGPRPVVPDELVEYGPQVTAYLMARPGLTGPWQVSGRDAVKFPNRANIDADYVDCWSLGRDLHVLARTIPAAITARGVG